MNKDKLKNISELPKKERYGYFIMKVADFQVVWVIEDDSQLVTMGDNSNNILLPVWPEKEFAELFLTDEWAHYAAVSIDLEEFFEMLDNLIKEGKQLAPLPIPGIKAMAVSASDMKNNLIYEMSQYE